MSEEKKSVFAYERKSVWLKASDTEKNLISDFASDYKKFMNECKTERECVRSMESEALKLGFIDIDSAEYSAGAKFILKNSNRNTILVIIGKRDIKEGVNIIASHIDAPRLDLKPVPMVEDSDMALLKTHYYGGIKKYQWVNIPLAIHGVIFNSGGEKLEISIGENENDPVFTINDILPHLSGKVQGEKKLLDGIEGENLKLLIGNIPSSESDIQDKVKAMTLKLLNDLYGIKEEDFISAELEIVPAFRARDIGFDRSMVGAYGHDDRACSYSAFRSIVDFKDIPDRTLVVLLVDKEEIGSFGVTGIRSMFLYNSIGRILGLKYPDYKESDLRILLEKSFCISGDVGAVINPMFKDVFDSTNGPRMGYGVLLEKYTGSRGKYGASDAAAEMMSKIRNIFNDNGIIWQPSILGKVDEGGGGTVALYLADRGIQVVDCGVGVDGMHSPFEVLSKADLYETYKAYKAFLKHA
jgi:aspartyl aminopeptidase